MYMSAETLDDLLIRVYKRLLSGKGTYQIRPRKGAATEIFGGLLQIANPRARLSRTEGKNTFFSCIGELLWYLSGTDRLDFIQHYIPGYEKYSDDKETIFGAYGPRLYNLNGINQLDNIIAMLKDGPDSRRAVVQLFKAEDLARDLASPVRDLPCTCTLQFTVRKERLHMLTMMRSNDAFKGLPHDVFAFTMLQEIMARRLGYEVGSYRHAVGSFHLYEDDVEKAKQYIEEGLQSRISMPAMPKGDPQESIALLLQAEASIRQGKRTNLSKMAPYWADLARLLKIYNLTINPSEVAASQIRRLRSQMHSNVYEIYIDKRARRKAVKTSHVPMDLFSGGQPAEPQPPMVEQG
ncbi:thymidylate synthase [Burkholderia pseudomallei]|uniref:thymidylate synthase n=1 Tax=Burkholderia pseudomallei TaxID=28450 RepID=UPI00097892AD|nr:thymidylate synthase [Burkholderia pseudomallei]OMR89994.1 thymidylate synthase [Burkholderia pseudomallei]OMS16456.1 thymidylate synthase [Burkholderia pseudomallei]